MKLDKYIVDMFADLTKPVDDVKMEKTCYGTISVVDGTRYVKLDGSDLLVPAASTVKTSHGDRVTVLMKNHSLTITGNLTAPATDNGGSSSGEAGTAATIEVGTVTTGEAGTSASVTNSGTTSAAVFDFVIPRGDKGEKGDTGTWDGTIPDHEHTMGNITDWKTTANLMLQAICPNNELLYDDLGAPSVMVKIPKMTWAQLGVGDSTEVFPAFIVKGQVVDALYFPKYENVVQNNRGYSLPARDPAVNVNFYQSIAYSMAKGVGWHSMTRLEWSLIALWCLQNGFQPNGNNDYGKDISENTYKAVPTAFNADGTTARVATGTGPLTWSHNNAPDGVYDLNGNVWEWTTGVRLEYGELQVLSYDGVTFGNDAAAADLGDKQTAGSAYWRAIDGTTGAFRNPAGSGATTNSLKLDYTSSGWKWVTGTISNRNNSNRSTYFENITVDSTVCDAAQRILQALCLYKTNSTAGAYKNDIFWGNNGAAEMLFYAGGPWIGAAYDGVFGVYCCALRSNALPNLGFRSAFVNLPTGDYTETT